MPGRLLPAVESLRKARWGFLTAITGLDDVKANEIEVLYHFVNGSAIVNLRVRIPRDNAVDSQHLQPHPGCDVLRARVERDVRHQRHGHAQPRSVVPARPMADGRAAAAQRFRHAADVSKQNQEASRARITMPTLEKFIVPIGPQHPALKEPGHFEFTVDGETVTAASVRLGYVHRGIEKATEDRNWTQNLYLLERICGICSHTHALCYSLGVEALAEVTAPPRAQAIRSLVAELERVHSHLLWLGVAAHEGGFDTLFMYSWRDRETIMDVLEGLTGNRVNYSANVLGGVKFDVDEKQIDAIKRGVDYLEERTQHYLKSSRPTDLHPPHARRGHAHDRASRRHRRDRADGARVGHRARCARGCAVCSLQHVPGQHRGRNGGRSGSALRGAPERIV